MAIPCKICTSDKKESIETMILQGNSNYEVANHLKAIGLDISHATVNRHKKEHMMDYKAIVDDVAKEKNNRKNNKDTSQNEFTIDAIAIYSDIENEIDIFDYEKSAKNFIAFSLTLIRIAKNQGAIVIDLQEKYMKGECKYPFEQLNGLDKIQSLIIKHESFQNKSYEYMKEIHDKRNSLFNNESRHLDSELEVMKWIKDRPYVKGHMFNLIKCCNYDLNKSYEIIVTLYTPDTSIKFGYFDVTKYREDDYILDMDIYNALADLDDENEIRDYVNRLINWRYDEVLKELKIPM